MRCSTCPLFLVALLLAAAVEAQHHHLWRRNVDEVNEDARDERFLELTDLFDELHSPCTATDGTAGRCELDNDCEDIGGTLMDPSCSGGFGKCCVVSNLCDTISSSNNSYFSHPDTHQGSCKLTVTKPPDVCQLRLNFEEFEIDGPDADPADLKNFGKCNKDKFTVKGGAFGTIGPICGYNTGQHLIVDMKKDLTLRFDLGSSNNQRWNIKVIQIECCSCNRAPAGCTQYFTGHSGDFSSFNFRVLKPKQSVHLQDQRQVICIRPEKNHCTISYSPDPKVPLRNNGGNQAIGISLAINRDDKAAMSDPLCNKDYLLIPNAVDARDVKASTFCGLALGAVPATSVVGGTVVFNMIATSSAAPLTANLPFQVTFITNDQEEVLSGASTEASRHGGVATRGFSIHYQQNKCMKSG